MIRYWCPICYWCDGKGMQLLGGLGIFLQCSVMSSQHRPYGSSENRLGYVVSWRILRERGDVR
jgi:hypothetical protein